MSLVRRMTFLKEKGESALFQGSRSLGEKGRAEFFCRGQEQRDAGVQGEEVWGEHLGAGESLKGRHGVELASHQH